MTPEEEKEIWKKLLSCNRINDLGNAEIENECTTDLRNPFQRDCDRITYSYPFRRLQDKTQVIPIPILDFVHTRLTHTLEVATVGRSLGALLEKYLIGRQIIDSSNCNNIPAILTAACLAHDIGNPPFGHSGEDAISEYFTAGRGGFYLNQELYDPNDPIAHPTISERCKMADLNKFEGNAMGFRLLTKHDGLGLNLTCATLATFSKYPRQSFITGEEILSSPRWSSRVSQKKYGFFQTELPEFKKLANEVGLQPLHDHTTHNYSWARHPLAFLMEAADDICYRIIDLEDGFRIGRIPFTEAEGPLLAIAEKDDRYDPTYYNSFARKREKQKFTYLRSLAINTLINQAFQVFIGHYDGILNASFDQDLIQSAPNQEIVAGLNAIKGIVKTHIYKWDKVLSDEAAGFEILGALLSEYIEASNICLSCPPETRSKRASKIFDLLAEEHQHLESDESYVRYLKIASYVAGMTDSFAINLFKRLKGIST